MRSGGQILVETLRRHGVDRIFCVPGESFLAVLDALVDAPDIHVVTCRHEGGAAMMADAYAKLTNRPGVCFVSRGPGATNAAAGIHVAHQDSTPLVMFVGQIDRAARHREAFQEVDYSHMFGTMTKWAAEIDDVARLPEYVGRAFSTAVAGRPGPVVLALPEDLLTDTAPMPAIAVSPRVEAGLRPEDLDSVRGMLASAERPLVIVGGGGWTAETCEYLRRFAEAWALPVATSFRRVDHFDNTHPNYAGELALKINPDLMTSIRTADLLLVIGTRLSEAATQGYTRIDVPVPAQKMIHIHAGAEELGRVYHPTLAINAGMNAALKALAGTQPATAPAWAARTRDMHASYLAWSTPAAMPGPLQIGEIVTWFRDRLPADAIIANGAGNFAIWPNRFYRYRSFRTMVAPTSGSMGYGVPGAIAAKLQHPERIVVCFAGDGDFLMTGQELATARMYGAAIVVVLINNGMYGTIRMHQERTYPGRPSATALANPDFVALARSYGAHAEKITHTKEFAPAFERAIASGTPALLELVVDPDILSPDDTVQSLRKGAKLT